MIRGNNLGPASLTAENPGACSGVRGFVSFAGMQRLSLYIQNTPTSIYAGSGATSRARHNRRRLVLRGDGVIAVVLKPDARRRLAGAARLLLSDKPGEVAAAVSAMGRLLPIGVTVFDLIEAGLNITASDCGTGFSSVEPSPSKPRDISRPWQWQARFALGACPKHLIDDRELKFLRSMTERINTPTPKQTKWLNDIWSRGDRAVAA